MNHPDRSAGFTAIEVVLGAVVLSVIIGGVLVATSEMTRSAATGSTDTLLAKQGRRALRQVYDDLHRSGFDTVDGFDYPHVFEDGDADTDFDHHDHEAHTPVWGGPFQREIVFRLPLDADEDGIPDLDADRMATWADEEISYVVNTAAEGGGRLERRVDALLDRVVARYVDRIAFDDAVTSGFAIPLDAVRVQIDLSKPDGKGVLHTHTVESVFQLRNGGIVQ